MREGRHTQTHHDTRRTQAEAGAKAILQLCEKIVQDDSKSKDISYELAPLHGEDPRDVIVDFLVEVDADMVVMGTRGLSPLKKLVMGRCVNSYRGECHVVGTDKVVYMVYSVSDHVLAYSPCAVMLVK